MGVGGIQPKQHIQPLLTTRNQSSGKQSKIRDVTMSQSQSDDGSRWEPKLSQ